MQNDNFSVISQRVVKCTLLDSPGRVPCAFSSWHRRFILFFPPTRVQIFSYNDYVELCSSFRTLLLPVLSSTWFYRFEKLLFLLHVFIICEKKLISKRIFRLCALPLTLFYLRVYAAGYVDHRCASLISFSILYGWPLDLRE